jgi:hypothetical protein
MDGWSATLPWDYFRIARRPPRIAGLGSNLRKFRGPSLATCFGYQQDDITLILVDVV